MLNPTLLRDNIEETATRLSTRYYTLNIKEFNKLEHNRKTLQVETQNLQQKRNQLSKEIGRAKANGKEPTDVLEEVNGIVERLKAIESEFEIVQTELDSFLMEIPNLPHPSVPIGKTEEDNKEILRWGTPKEFDFEPKDHIELGEQLSLLDFESASKLSGARFAVFYGPLVTLHRALIHFMIDLQTREHGYEEIYVPYLVNSDSLYGTSQLPKFAHDQFKVEADNDLYLIPTAEVPVTNIVRNRILDSQELPIKYVCHTPCFRKEAGSYGKDTKGLMRQHQFEKVEIVQIVKPENSYEALEELTSHAQSVLQHLELPYRVVSLCTGDIGFAAAKTYDLEVWLPGQNRYREISSCSNTEDFQARRMVARFKDPSTGKMELVHTLNGSGLAIGRTMIAIMENCQDDKGNIHIPRVLLPYMNGLEVIGV